MFWRTNTGLQGCNFYFIYLIFLLSRFCRSKRYFYEVLSFIHYIRLVADAANCIQDIIGEGKSQQEAWNSCTVRLFWAARVCLSFCIKQWCFSFFFQIQKDTSIFFLISFHLFFEGILSCICGWELCEHRFWETFRCKH